MRPNKDFVVIEPQKTERQGNIFIPEEYQISGSGSGDLDERNLIPEYSRAGIGQVLAVGPGYYDDSREEYIVPDVEVGDMVAYERASAVAFPWWEGTNTAVCVRSEAVYFKVEEDSLEVTIDGLRTKEVG